VREPRLLQNLPVTNCRLKKKKKADDPLHCLLLVVIPLGISRSNVSNNTLEGTIPSDLGSQGHLEEVYVINEPFSFCCKKDTQN
jgi:hypothetical protein